MMRPSPLIAPLLVFCAVTAWCCLAEPAKSDDLAIAEATTGNKVPALADQLVLKLGDSSFQVRERASRELLELGLEVRSALETGMQRQNLEIALRCRNLWDEIRINVGRQQVTSVIGDAPAAGELFEKMFQADPPLWYVFVINPQPASELFPGRRTQLQQILEQPTVAKSILEGSLANAFYFGVLAKQANPQQQLESMDDLLRVGRCQQALQDNESLRALRDMWAIATANDEPSIDKLIAAMKAGRPDAAPIARKILADERLPAGDRQYALLALAKIRSPADDALVRQALTDSTPLDTLFIQGFVIKTQVRDVALAVAISRAGYDPTRFGFAHAKPDPYTVYSPATLGFENDTQRKHAIKAWRAFTAIAVD